MNTGKYLNIFFLLQNPLSSPFTLCFVWGTGDLFRHGALISQCEQRDKNRLQGISSVPNLRKVIKESIKTLSNSCFSFTLIINDLNCKKSMQYCYICWMHITLHFSKILQGEVGVHVLETYLEQEFSFGTLFWKGTGPETGKEGLFLVHTDA